MESEFIYILLSMVLVSITSYIIFASYYIGREVCSYKKFIDHVIAFSCVSMIGSILMVIKLIFIDYNEPGHLVLKHIAIFICLFLIFLTSDVLKRSMKGNILDRMPFRAVLFANVLLLGVFVFFSESYRFYYNVILSVFSVIVLIFLAKVYLVLEHKKNIGITYILFSASALLVWHLISLPLSFELKAATELALMTLFTVGMFIFYNNYYIIDIEKRINEAEEQSRLLNESNIKLEKVARTDEVTLVGNKLGFEIKLSNILEDTYIMLINVKNFMKYNNLLGYSQGDKLLKTIAQEIQSVLPKEMTLYRLYSDKFLLCANTASREKLEKLIHQINEVFLDDNRIGLDLELYFGGLLYRPLNMGSIEDKVNYIMTSLEIASSEAKVNSETFYEYSTKDLLSFKNTVNLELKLLQAIINNDFMVWYQPQVDTKTLEIVSYEALIRWRLDGNYIPPDIFIRIAEDKGKISGITYFVIKQVFEDIAYNNWVSDERVSINLSAVELVEPELVTYIEKMIELYPTCRKNIAFEITETTLFNDVDEVRDNIARLVDMGFGFSLDDFGSGYSSLYRFAQLEIEEVKFDKIFVQEIAENEKILLTFKKSVELFKSFGMRIVAEGVENQEQLKLLETMPIDLYQGYKFYKPMPLKEFL